MNADVDYGISLEPTPLTNFSYKTELEILVRNLDAVQREIHAALQASKQKNSEEFVSDEQFGALHSIADLLSQSVEDMSALLSFREQQSHLIAEAKKAGVAQ